MIVKPPFLSLPELRAAGVPEPWAFGRRDWVRSGEIDSLNHVNNTDYLIWFETVRVGYMHALDPSPYPRLQTVLKSLTAEFHQEMNVNEEYLVTARTSSFRTSSFVQDYAVFAGNLRGHRISDHGHAGRRNRKENAAARFNAPLLCRA